MKKLSEEKRIAVIKQCRVYAILISLLMGLMALCGYCCVFAPHEYYIAFLPLTITVSMLTLFVYNDWQYLNKIRWRQYE